LIETALLEDLATAHRLYPGSTEQYFAITFDVDSEHRDVVKQLTMEVDEAISAYNDLETQGRAPRLYVTHVVMTQWEEYNPGLAYADDEEAEPEVTGSVVATSG
jgi:hypothetical protein